MAVVDAEKRPTPESRPPAGHTALIERFAPDVIDVPSGSARIRLAVDGEGEWESVIDDGAIKLELAPAPPETYSGYQPWYRTE